MLIQGAAAVVAAVALWYFICRIVVQFAFITNIQYLYIWVKSCEILKSVDMYFSLHKTVTTMF